ncbi:S1 RNA binding domain [Liquorilactobacillus sucicola DSM 21376 = JCM 15457]|uniref:RNA-binding protein n=1 Tax=Liquorilactobacillus sucicola DSM 21376 = JCM 15457 TaxID=1423806 RepID=A0A023CUK8_9LACO|nr:S1-like domain-containing RNA-binding protein [Liquorilactobacillus sucicola]KRN05432.1 hypothetical protein FD15_GL001987 [Liquorilactobacillus sucicola DSM 21376 = JCM 15457]GAJ25509.1 S1 RNA binding domain [Liquorilactobacillus sucicola DSM 21376 = JCM 15457]
MENELKELLGKTIKVVVTDENDVFYFAQQKGLTFKIDKSEFEHAVEKGTEVTGFAYENADHELQVTQNIPKSGIDQYGFGEVVAVRRNLGVFVDIGLPNKDIVVSLDDLPEVTRIWPKKGDKLLVGLKSDNKNRLWGDLASEDIFRGLAAKADAKMQNQDVFATTYRMKMAGTHVLTDDYYLGFIHPSERDEEPRLGQRLKARVIGVRPDGILNLSLRPRAYEAISDDAQMILAALEHQGGQLSYTDKSSPEDIKTFFGISKGQFKRAVGHLMKAGLVRQENGKLILNKQQ